MHEIILLENIMPDKSINYQVVKTAVKLAYNSVLINDKVAVNIKRVFIINLSDFKPFK